MSHQKFIGFQEDSFEYIRQYSITNETLEISQHLNARVVGARPSWPGEKLQSLSGGAFDTSGNLISDCLQPRSDGQEAIASIQPVCTRIPAQSIPEAVFGGLAFDHFGHFLLESTARLWALPKTHELPWIFISVDRETLPEYQLGFLEILGLPRERVIVVPGCVKVERLLIPQPSFTYHHHATHAYRDTFRAAQLRPTSTHTRRIFLSRQNSTIARTVGERELETVLNQDGWEIVYPENLSARAQAELFSNDTVVLGMQGSAFHLSLFASPGHKVVHLCRGEGYRAYYLLDELMGLDATYLQAVQTDLALPSKPITGPFLLDVDRTLAFLHDEGLLSSLPDTFSTNDVGTKTNLIREYEAWWHYTESKLRFFHGTAHDGSTVSKSSSLEFAERSLELLPNDAEIVAHAAALALKFSSPDHARMLLQRYPDPSGWTDMDRAKLHYFKSQIEDMAGQFDDALFHAEQANRLAPQNISYTNQNAAMLYRLTRATQAQDILDQAVSTGIANASSHHVLSLVHESVGHLSEAVLNAELAFRLDPADQNLFRRAFSLYRHTEQFEKAKTLAKTYIDSDTQDPLLLREIADFEEIHGDPQQAIILLRKLYFLNQNDHDVRQQLYNLLQADGQLPDLSGLGADVTHAALERSVMIHNHGLSRLEEGRLGDALYAAVAAASITPGNETIMMSVVGVLLRLNNPFLVRLLIHTLLERGEAYPSLYYTLSLAEGELGNSEAAQNAAKIAAEKAPFNATITDHYQRMIT